MNPGYSESEKDVRPRDRGRDFERHVLIGLDTTLFPDPESEIEPAVH